MHESTNLLIGSWDLVAIVDDTGARSLARPDAVGLVTFSADGTFTLQMQPSASAVVSLWGHYQVQPPTSVVHIIEWHIDPARIGTTERFAVASSDATHLELVSEAGVRLVFER